MVTELIQRRQTNYYYFEQQGPYNSARITAHYRAMNLLFEIFPLCLIVFFLHDTVNRGFSHKIFVDFFHDV